ncbi:N-terminal domain of NEFA-interacting nuclear protein NIP30 domain-containing protein [Trichoderma chlorosporum]
MSGRFVSGGTMSGEGPKDESGREAAAAVREPLAKKSVEWETVQHELDEERRRREQARAELAEGSQQSLYDILQANKAAKQAAFEEQNKLKNQFRALDDDEIEFLDEVRAKEKAEEERARREVEEGLKAFRERQKSTGGGGSGSGGEISGAAREDGGGKAEGEEQEEWAVGGRKRKRHEREVLGVKKKAVVGDRERGRDEAGGVEKTGGDEKKKREGEKEKEKETEPPKEEKKTSLGLVAYDSDSDDDD